MHVLTAIRQMHVLTAGNAAPLLPAPSKKSR